MPYVNRMTRILFLLLCAVMLAILVVLVLGMIGVVRGGDGRRSNALMRARVYLQGAALVLMGLLVLSKK